MRRARSQTAWEARALDQVLRDGRERVLSRSRKFVEAGTTIVSENGIDGLTLRKLLQRTGLSRRAFYQRFESKDDLLLAVFEQTIQTAADMYREELQSIGDPLERLRALITGMITRAWSAPAVPQSTAMSREHLRLAESRPNDLRRALQPLTDLIAEQLAAGIAARRIRALELRETAALIHNLVSSTLHSALLSDPDEATGDAARAARADAMAGAVWEFCRRAILADPS